MTNWPNTIQCLGSDDIMSVRIKSSATEVLGSWSSVRCYLLVFVANCVAICCYLVLMVCKKGFHKLLPNIVSHCFLCLVLRVLCFGWKACHVPLLLRPSVSFTSYHCRVKQESNVLAMWDSKSRLVALCSIYHAMVPYGAPAPAPPEELSDPNPTGPDQEVRDFQISESPDIHVPRYTNSRFPDAAGSAGTGG